MYFCLHRTSAMKKNIFIIGTQIINTVESTGVKFGFGAPSRSAASSRNNPKEKNRRKNPVKGERYARELPVYGRKTVRKIALSLNRGFRRTPYGRDVKAVEWKTFAYKILILILFTCSSRYGKSLK